MPGALTYLEPPPLDRPDRPYPRHATHPEPPTTRPMPARHAMPPASASGQYDPPPEPGGHPADVAPHGYRVAGSPPHSPPDSPSPYELALPDLRNKVVNRLHDANALHFRSAWERRRRDPLNAHALAFFYAEPPTGDPPRCQLRAAGRWFLGDDEAHLPLLLYEMVGVAEQVLQDGGDPRTDLANWHDPMSIRAAYIGLGISSLDTPAGTWAQIQRSAGSDLDIPGRCYGRLIDGTLLLVDRLAKLQFGRVHVWSTHRLDSAPGELVRHWNYGHRVFDPALQDQTTRDTWQWLNRLHHVLLGGSHAR